MVNKITEADLINKGVVGLPDVPGLTTIEMQNKFEEISRDVIIPRFNELIDNTVSASDEFSKLNTYNVGDYCIYQSVLYKCTTEITTAGEWDATKWKATAIDKELKEISSTPENKDAISDKYDSSKTYAVGDYCIYNDTLYKCKTAVTSAEEFDSSKWEATNCGKELVALNSNLFCIRVIEKTITPSAKSTAFGGYQGFADISSDISDISDKIISIIPISYGRIGSSNIGGFCHMQDNTVVRLNTNYTTTENVKITVIYTK